MQHRHLVESVFVSAALFAFLIPLCSWTMNYHGAAPARWVEKCFAYDIDNQYWHYPPVVGLNVTFGTDQQPLWWQLTDPCGCVEFGSGLPDGRYWFEWTWGGTPYHEDIAINCSKLVWSYENLLPAKGDACTVTVTEA